ncbi:recombinase family protein [Streptomyces sp. MOE7]|uniref:recombinase family protein n=1 Tax=Streptomyces sp. MOE7 TaxID=1961713 RepID=UPI000A0817C1|nr:hypothetical protein STRMOE7_01720 [Streptomyces sp. MOE7]
MDRQLADAEDYRRRLDWGPVSNFYRENETSAFKAQGHPSQRIHQLARRAPAYRQLLTDLGNGVIDGAICYDLDRLVRRPRGLEDLLDIVEHRSHQQPHKPHQRGRPSHGSHDVCHDALAAAGVSRVSSMPRSSACPAPRTSAPRCGGTGSRRACPPPLVGYRSAPGSRSARRRCCTAQSAAGGPPEPLSECAICNKERQFLYRLVRGSGLQAPARCASCRLPSRSAIAPCAQEVPTCWREPKTPPPASTR